MFRVLKSVLRLHYVDWFCDGINSRSDEVGGRGAGWKEVSKYIKEATNNT